MKPLGRQALVVINISMKLFELCELSEAVGANSIYHYTSLRNLLNIIPTNTLVASPQQGRIYFTRDYGRQFVPASFLSDSVGLRMDADVLKRTFGKKLHPQGQMRLDWPKDVFASNWFLSRQERDELMRVKQGGTPSGLLIKGERPQDVLAGRVGAVKRWESEEVLEVKQLPNLMKYVTGLVIAISGGKVHTGRKAAGDVTEKLAETLIWFFGKGQQGRATRDKIFAWMKEHDIPFVFQGRDVPWQQARDAMIKIFQDEKQEREHPNKQSWIVDILRGGEVVKRYAIGASSAEKAVLKIKKETGWDDPSLEFKVSAL